MEQPEDFLEEGNSCEDQNPAPDQNSQSEVKNQELLAMTVEIGDGRQDIIIIYENDDPSQLAQDFAKKHFLDKSMQHSLESLIKQNKEAVMKNAKLQDPGKVQDFYGSYSSSRQQEVIQQRDNKKKKPKAAAKDDFNYNAPNDAPHISSGSIYERLAKQSKTARPKTASSASTSQLHTNKQNPSKRNYGEWLYLKGLKQKETAKQKIENKKNEIEEKSAKEFTFTPSINKTSGSVASSRNEDKLENYLIKKGKQYEEHKEKIKAEVEEEQMKECSFVPAIKERQLKSRDYSKSVHEELFQQASKRKEKKLEQEINSIKQFSFRPDIAKQRTTETKEEFVERLINSKLKFEEEMEAARQSQIVTHDESTGQQLFRPQTYSKVNRSADTPIWEHLYSLKDVKAANIDKELRMQTERLAEASISGRRPSDNSQKIFEKFKTSQLERIFKLLDSDQDGSISSGNISIDTLEDKTCEIMAPIFEEIEEENLTLDFAAFVEKMNELLKNLNIEEKAYILKRETKPEPEEVKKPRISEMSIKLSEKSRGNLPENIYERLTMTQQLKQLKLVKEREEREMAEVKQCTFRPSLRSR
ncbi:unnamed protein product [Blepharisma stoltei]|uniref:EF-hand domain-containing protein n=1 Tax=Blepharisma stoltei TaxID=1481888 RepID=A0AAU9IRH3_9CILI|nr:unnamed protein product [Blepharisma stoltei]